MRNLPALRRGAMMTDSHDMELLLRPRIPLIIIETRDEKRVSQLFASLAVKLAMPAMSWPTTTGLHCHRSCLKKLSV